MKFVNLPADWNKKYFIIGYGLSNEEFDDTLQKIREIIFSDRNFIGIVPNNPNAIIEFVELPIDDEEIK